MKVKYERLNTHKDNDFSHVGLVSFVVEHLLKKNPYESYYGDDIPLEEKPRVLVEAFGRLLEVLLSRRVISTVDFHSIIDSRMEGRSEIVWEEEE